MDITWTSYDPIRSNLSFDKFSLDTFCDSIRNDQGAYIIWIEENKQIIYVGSGSMAELWTLLYDSHFVPFKKQHLILSYARINDVDDNTLLGVGKFLTSTYHPTIGNTYSDEILEVPVNLPEYL